MMNLLRRYLTLGVIVTLPLPEQIANGDVVDAVPAMANWNYIAAQVNANAAALASVPTFSGIIPFTPGLSFGGASTGITYAFRAGAYFKVQNVVFYTLDMVLSALGSASGIAAVTGLPLAINTNFPIGSAPPVPIVTKNVDFPDGYLAGLLNSGGTTITLLNVVTGFPWIVLTETEFASNSQVMVSGFYST